MKTSIAVYDAKCCRTWIMPAECFDYPGGACKYCGNIPIPLGNFRRLPMYPPEQYITNHYRNYEQEQSPTTDSNSNPLTEGHT